MTRYQSIQHKKKKLFQEWACKGGLKSDLNGMSFEDYIIYRLMLLEKDKKPKP